MICWKDENLPTVFKNYGRFGSSDFGEWEGVAEGLALEAALRLGTSIRPEILSSPRPSVGALAQILLGFGE